MKKTSYLTRIDNGDRSWNPVKFKEYNKIDETKLDNEVKKMFHDKPIAYHDKYTDKDAMLSIDDLMFEKAELIECYDVYDNLHVASDNQNEPFINKTYYIPTKDGKQLELYMKLTRKPGRGSPILNTDNKEVYYKSLDKCVSDKMIKTEFILSNSKGQMVYGELLKGNVAQEFVKLLWDGISDEWLKNQLKGKKKFESFTHKEDPHDSKYHENYVNLSRAIGLSFDEVKDINKNKKELLIKEAKTCLKKMGEYHLKFYNIALDDITFEKIEVKDDLILYTDGDKSKPYTASKCIAMPCLDGKEIQLGSSLNCCPPGVDIKVKYPNEAEPIDIYSLHGAGDTICKLMHCPSAKELGFE
jgi:predicted GIY-YIG superfamily endonuclease